MRVIAIHRGHAPSEPGAVHRLLEPGTEFVIHDTPVRALTDDDDEITRSIAVKGKVPTAFSSSWMKPVDAGKAEAKPSKAGKAESKPNDDGEI